MKSSKSSKYIKISRDFSNRVKGKKFVDSEFNGERFRKEFLESCWNDFDKFVIDLDDSYGYPQSFLDGAFYELARLKSPEEVLNKIEFICEDEPPLTNQIKENIRLI